MGLQSKEQRRWSEAVSGTPQHPPSRPPQGGGGYGAHGMAGFVCITARQAVVLGFQRA